MAAKKPKVVKEEPKVVKPPERSTKCGNCGAKNEFDAIVCTSCGYNRLNLVVREGDRIQEYH